MKPDNTEELREKLANIVKRVDALKTPEMPDGNPYLPGNLSHEEATDALLQLITTHTAKQKDNWEKEAKLLINGNIVEFTHTAVNKDMHLFIDGVHNPDVCPECIRPGVLSPHLSSKEQKGTQ